MSDKLKATGFLARGGAWVIAQFALMLAVIILGLICPGGWTRGTIIGLGLLPITVGAAFGVAGVLALGRNRTAYPRPLEDATLVQHGIYAHVRHPLYTSVILVSLGWSGLWQSWPALLAALVLIPFLAAKARCEETWLREKYAGYVDYARRVPRFFPRLWHGGKNRL